MLAPEVIRKKRDGGTLTRQEIAFLVGGITDGGLSDAQVGALAMAFFLRAVFGDHDLGTATVPARPGTAQPDTARPASSAAGRPWWVTPRVRRYADLTFGVFLLHPLPLELLVRRDQPEFASPYVDIAFHLGVIVALVVGCAVVTFVLRQVPVLRRLV